jgi:hypothetical protein
MGRWANMPKIVDVLSQPLPEPNHSYTPSNTSAKASSKTVQNQELPHHLILAEPEFWTDPANDYIRKAIEDEESVLHATSSPIEESLTIDNEECVAQSARAYLIHPVMLVLNEKYRTTIEYHLEVKTKESGKLRVDFVWTFKREGKNVTVAILEYKHRGYIRVAEFEKAEFKARRPDKRVVKRPKFGPYNSEIKGNAFKFVRQVAVYVIDEKCPYVSLFDWNALVLMHCDKLQGVNIGPIVRATAIAESNDFRKALLGFLLEACKGADVPIPSLS